MSKPRTELARVLREAREASGLTLEQVADRMSKSITTVHDYESGRVEPPGLTLLRLARVLGVDVRRLMTKLAA